MSLLWDWRLLEWKRLKNSFFRILTCAWEELWRWMRKKQWYPFHDCQSPGLFLNGIPPYKYFFIWGWAREKKIDTYCLTILSGSMAFWMKFPHIIQVSLLFIFWFHAFGPICAFLKGYFGSRYHLLNKSLKVLIRRSRNCPYIKLLDKHCGAPSLDQISIGNSSSMFEVSTIWGKHDMVYWCWWVYNFDETQC